MVSIVKTAALSSTSSVEDKLKIKDENLEKNFPDDLVSHIFSFLNGKTLLTCSLVNRNWKELSRHPALWTLIFKTDNLSGLQISKPTSWTTYENILAGFPEIHCLKMELLACMHYAQTNSKNAAYRLKELCKKACDVKDFNIALDCAFYAEKYSEHAGAMADHLLIKNQVECLDSLSPENSILLIIASLYLIDSSPEYGLKSLFSVAKKFADWGNFIDAIMYADLGETLGSTRGYTGGNLPSDEPLGFDGMVQHMLNLHQVVFSNACLKSLFSKENRKYNSNGPDVDNLITHEMNEAAKKDPPDLSPEQLIWMQAYKQEIYRLIDSKKYEEAQKITIRFLKITSSIKDYKFRQNLNTTLTSRLSAKF
jgi:hypothetical protein